MRAFGSLWTATISILSAVAGQEYDHLDAEIIVVDVQYNSSEISFSLPDNIFSGPGYDRDLCLHPSPDIGDMQHESAEESYLHRGITPLIVTHAVEARTPLQCVVHQEDALAVCAKLIGCEAMTCLPLDNFAALDPPQRPTPQGILVGAKKSTEAMLEASIRGNLQQLEAALQDGSDVDAVDWVTGRTALMEATLRGDLRMVEVLLAWGASAEVRDHQRLRAVDYSEHVEVVSNRHSHLEVERLLRERSFQEILAADRLTTTQIDSPEHERVAVRMAMSPDSPRASIAEMYMREGIYGPLCLARGHTSVNMPRSPKCSVHATSPHPRCMNLITTRRHLNDVIDLPRVPAKEAMKLHLGIRAGYTLVAVPPDASGELWYQTWERGDDVVGEAPKKNAPSETLMLVFVR